MTLAVEIILAVLCAALLLTLNRKLLFRLIHPSQKGTIPVFAVVPAAGDGEGLEHTLRHLLWLQEEKLSAFTILVVDAGLTPTGLDTVRALLRKEPTLLFCPAEEATLILQRKDAHDCCTL
ncbi:MAG: hypothetical protein IKB65_08645 [Ruminiclostridium sp.]|nr:hypothetical protein [Ruminiclostridium sp.]